MIEVAFTYDFHPNIDEDSYRKVARKATAMIVAADGFIELRANRNLLGSPQVRRSSIWQSMSHCAIFAEDPEFQSITNEFRKFATNMEVNIWGPSPYLPEPIRR